MKAGLKSRLLDRLRAGDPEAQQAFFDEHVAGVRRYARRCFVGSEHEADEITVDVFYRAFRSISRYAERSSLQVWLLGIARIAAAEHFRTRRRPSRSGRAGTSPVDGEALPVEVTGSGNSDTPLSSLLRVEKRERLLDQLDRLRGEHREVITLRLISGLSNREIGEIMNRSEDAVKMLFFRALQSLTGRIKADSYFKNP